jgi:putative chitinase
MFDVKRAQQRLIDHGYSLSVDGLDGPRTYAALYRFMARDRITDAAALERGRAAVVWFPKADLLSGSGLRLVHWFGQTCVESMGFTRSREIWGPTPAQRGYEGRKDLGNTQPGDGKRFMGRADIEITGRGNYRAAGQRLGMPLEEHPELAEQMPAAIAISIDYWSAHHLNQWADADDVIALSKAINCGNAHSRHTPNGLADRQVATARARTILL